MHPATNRTRESHRHSFRITVRTGLKLLTLLLVTASVSFAVFVRVHSKDSVALKNQKAEVTVHAAGRGKPFLNLRDGRQTSINYRGDRELAAALQGGTARARALASADFDQNGTPDVVAGYASDGIGVITVQRGNPDAFAPSDDSVFVRTQQGYNPDSLLPNADVYSVPASPDFLLTGNFTHDSEKDILFAAKGGALYLMAGDGTGRFGAPQQIDLPGSVTALAAGEFRAADGFTDIAVGVSGAGGDSLLIFDAVEGLSKALVEYPLDQPASGIEFGGLDDDPFMDVAVAEGTDLLVVHGWGRKAEPTAASRVERFKVGANLRGLAVGEFAWDRQGRSEIAALSDDGMVHIVQNSKNDARPFTEAEAAQRTRANFRPKGNSVDVESAAGWQPGQAAGWAESSSFTVSSFGGANSPATKPLMRANLSYRETDDLLVLGESQPKLEIVRSVAPSDKAVGEISAAGSLTRTTLDVDSTPVAVLTLPKKLNGVSDVVVLNSTSSEPSIIPNAPNTTITVDRTDDPSGAALTAASACTAAASDCSLRGAIQFSNLPSNNNTTISLPANTYVLSINGTSVPGCDGNTVGDLGANQTMTITGAGAATTIIRQTGTGPGNDGDRIMCMNEVFATGLVYNFSGVTFVGGREGTAAGGGAALGGGGIIGGELNNSLTLTNVVMANNQVTVLGSNNLGGGALQITGGNLIITNSTFGGSSAPGAYTDRTSTNTANLQAGSGGGVTFTPSSPQHAGGTGTLTVTGSTFSRNTAAGIGGGGGDFLIFAFGAPGGIGSGSASIGTSTLSNNQALGTASGGGFIVESLPTTVATTSLTSNSAGNRGGGIFVGGGSLLLNGTTPSITFTGNTATSGGSSVSTSAPVNVDGTNTTIGGDIEIGTGGVWTNNAGSTLAPTNVVITGGTLTMNNSTMNVGGNLTIGPGAVVGGTFNGNTGTVNIQGNFVLNAGGAPATTLNAGTGTFNFNGTGTQSITNGTSITFFNLTDSNVTNPLTVNNSFAVNSSLNVNAANAILSPVAAAVISGTGTLTGTGTARASRIAATPDFLSQYTITNKTLTNLTIDYNGAGTQTVNNTPAYSSLTISGTGTKTLQGNTAITRNLTTVAGATFASGNFNFGLGGNWTNGGAFTAGTGTVTFQGTTGTQLLTGNTTFFNLTLNNAGATTNFGTTTTTVGNDLVATAGTMDGGTSTIIFTGTGDNAGSISGAAAKNFHNLQINGPATISNTTGGNINILNDYINGGTFTQSSGLTTTFDIGPDGVHAMSGAGTSTFGVFAINTANTLNAGSHNFNVIGATFTVAGTGVFNGNTNTVTFNGAGAQGIAGDGSKNFNNLLINNANSVNVINGTGAVDAFVGGLLTLTTNLSTGAGAILQQGGTSTGLGDVIGTVRRTDLGAIERSFGNINNSITINSGTPPTQMDFNLVKAAPGTFPAGVKVVPRDITLTPTGGSGISATVKMRYIDPTELTPTSITETRLVLWKNVGGTTWTPQGGTPNTASDFVSLSGVSSFSEWAIAEASDLTLSKANNVSGSAVVGQPWNWTITATNTGSPATFTAGQTILSDNLPNSNVNYGTPTVGNVSNITGSANISCSIVSNDLTCTANGGSVTFDSNLGVSKFDVVFSATPQAAGTFQNPRTGGGIAQVDPNNIIVESNEGNNSATTNTVTVGKANTTTAITSDNPDPSVVGQPVTVQWSVTVNAPGTLGAALTGNVTVSDGTNQCVAAVSAGQCDVTFTSVGAKNLTATYAGDTNYNGSASSPATPHTVNKADTTTTITTDNPDPSSPGASVTVQWTVTVNAPGSGTPTGNVTVTVSGGAETCNAPVATGQCSLTLNGTGTRTITASYAGDTNFNTGSDTESHQICGTNLVTTNADSGAGSLRQIIANACDGGTITFDSAGVFATPQTITLTTGEILVDKSLTINVGSSQITLSGNNASRVFNIGSGKTVGIIGLTLTGGASANDAGAILNNGALTIVNSTLSGNAAVNDGGAINSSATATSLTLINTTISGNSAALNGGGVFVAGGTATITNSTITNNFADSDNNAAGAGGGIFVQAGTVTFKNTIVAGNFNEDGASDAADDVSGTVDPTSSFNLIGTGGAGGLTNGVNNNQVGVANPGLGPLANNGGKTQTHVLLPTSPALNAGSNANLPTDTFDLDGDANTAETLPVDQRGTGFPRIVGAAVDIGSLEANYAIAVTAGTPQSTAIGTAFATNLAATVTESGNPASGISVTFTAPASGASGTFANSLNTVTVSTNGSGVATASQFTANAIAGSYSVIGTSTGVPGSASFSLTNTGAPATHFLVSAPANATAGSAFSFTVTAQDQFNNTETGYSGTVHFTSTDGNVTLPADSTLTNGVGTFSATLRTAGNQTITATDTANNSITGTSNAIAVSAAGATHFSVSAPASATAGVAFSFTVTALDQFNNTATGYAGTVHFTSSDGQAVLPANSTLTNGVGTFSATLKTAGNQTITGTDTVTASITGTSGAINVSATAATHFTVSAPANATAGVAFSFTVTAQDQFNNTATGYAGTVHFTSSDGAAVLPANSTLTNGTGTFSATLKTAGNQTITATDTVTNSITGTSNTIAVGGGAATHFTVSAPASVAPGVAFSFTVTALDQFNNTATSYLGTVHFTSSDGAAVLPADNTLTNGVRTFSATLNTPGNQTITATDTANNSITGISNAINVNAGTPVITATAGNLSYTENAAATAIDPGVTVTDSDSSNLTGATVAITSGFVSAQDTLAFTNQLGITGSYNSGTGVLTLTGTATVASYQTALRSVTYQNSSDNPTASRTVTFSVSDGTNIGSASRGITITAVNDAPVNTVPGSQSTNLNTTLVFSSGNSNQISVADVDAGSNPIQVTLTATNGTLTLNGTSGLVFSVGDGTADATMTLTGTIANINTALNGMSFTPTAGFSGAASLTITTNDQGNTGTGGVLTDTDTVNIQVATTVSIQDAQVVEPTSGSANMIFTVALSSPAPLGGASVNFTTLDQAPAINHAVAGQDYTATSGTVNFATGEQVKTISIPVLADANNTEVNETFLVVLSSPVNVTIFDGTATGTILVSGPASPLLITELRTSGPAGAGDDFVEVYNNSDQPHTVNAPDASGGYGLFKMGAICGDTPVLIGMIPNGTMIPARGHYLFVGSAYSLANYGGSGAATGDQTLLSDIENDRNVGIFTTALVVNLSTANRLDAVGFGSNTGGSCDLLREGTTLIPLSGSTLEYSYVRDECGKKGNPAIMGVCPTNGFPNDTNVNFNDFIFVDTTAAVTVAGQRLGAPGPQNLNSPVVYASSIAALLLDATKGAPTSPNREREQTPQLPNAINGTLSIRRRFVNNTGQNITQLRFRIVDISSIAVTSGIADLRALSSGSVSVSGIADSATCLASNGSATTPCTVIVQGTTLETPPLQPLGGAHNSSMSAGTITLANPLAVGASINLQFLLGVQQTGLFKFYINIEALPTHVGPAVPTRPVKSSKAKIR